MSGKRIASAPCKTLDYAAARRALASGKRLQERWTAEAMPGKKPGRWYASKVVVQDNKFEWREVPSYASAQKPTYIGRAAELLREARMILSDSRTACPAKWQQECDELLKEIGK